MSTYIRVESGYSTLHNTPLTPIYAHTLAQEKDNNIVPSFVFATIGQCVKFLSLTPRHQGGTGVVLERGNITIGNQSGEPDGPGHGLQARAPMDGERQGQKEGVFEEIA